MDNAIKLRQWLEANRPGWVKGVSSGAMSQCIAYLNKMAGLSVPVPFGCDGPNMAIAMHAQDIACAHFLAALTAKPEEPAKAPEPAKWKTTVLGGAVPKEWLEAEAGEGTITFPYNIPADPPSTALPACAGLMRVWADPCWARR